MKPSTFPLAWGWGLAVMVGLLLTGKPLWAADGCDDQHRSCIEARFKNHKVRALTTWSAEFAKPLTERIGAASADLVDYVRLDNRLNGYTERPRAADVDAELMRDAKDALAEIPVAIRELFVHRLAGIFFVEELGSTGYTEYVDNRAGEHVAAFIVLDAGVLRKHTANSWATWKENTPFKPGLGYSLTAKIENPGSDSRKNAIQYILLHELGHVLSVGGNLHPPWDQRGGPVPKGRYPFLDLSWTQAPAGTALASRFDQAFVQRKAVVYYAKAGLAAADMLATYSSLELTNFPTLYAATRPGDDFAEAFASYVHVVLLGRPWNITIARDGQVAKVIDACWSQARCQEKRRMLEQLLFGRSGRK